MRSRGVDDLVVEVVAAGTKQTRKNEVAIKARAADSSGEAACGIVCLCGCTHGVAAKASSLLTVWRAAIPCSTARAGALSKPGSGMGTKMGL
jgi:hypothetical protein